MQNRWLSAELAPSSRAMCRGCMEKIEKGALRIGVCQELGDYNTEKWYHPDCLEGVHKSLHSVAATETQGYDNLEAKHQEMIRSAIDKLGKSSVKKKVSGKKKASTKQKPQQDESDEEQPKRKNKKEDADWGPEKTEKKQAPESSEGEESEIEQPKGYDAKEWATYLAHKTRLDKLKMPALKDKLRHNDQPMVGTKSDLVERVADGMTLGAIPKCPHCGGGRPRYNASNAKYKCPGYMEDTEFKRCNKVFSKQDIVRLEWHQEE